MDQSSGVRQTSVEAYHSITPTVTGAQSKIIIDAVSFAGDATLSEIAQVTGLRTSSIAGRVNELKRAGALVECESRKCSVTGRRCIPVRVAA